MKMDGVTLFAVVVIGAFAVERVARGILFALDMLDFAWWRRLSIDPGMVADASARGGAERRRSFAYFTLAFVLALVLTGFGKLRVLNAVGVDTTWGFDVILTALILVGGADRVADFLKAPGSRGGGDRGGDRPVQVSGTLVVEDAAAKRALTSDSR